jgi:hypothetical protein
MQNVCKAFTVCVVYYSVLKNYTIQVLTSFTLLVESGPWMLRLRRNPMTAVLAAMVGIQCPLSWAILGAKGCDNIVITVLAGHVHHLPHKSWQ